MGISYLTRHLLPYAETVSLGRQNGQDAPPRVHAVVIDGPSLVYHVYDRLLAWTDPSCDILDVQPTCDEVSRGVVSYLLQLANLGVEIRNIYFDGALPVSKRDTRLARIEKSRKRLETVRRSYVPSTREYLKRTSVRPLQLWQSRSLPARWKNLPENPFMVSAVLEDLENRWSKKRIEEEFQLSTHCLAQYNQYPWADITAIVPGEADTHCAEAARLTGCAVLTNDSDLLVHDLGPHGTVILLNSVQVVENPQDLVEPEIRGLKIHPYEVSRRLGIANIQQLAYTLTRHPKLSFVELLHRSKEDFEVIERSSAYSDFLREYQVDIDFPETVGSKKYAHILDPRVSELFWQFEMRDVYCRTGEPHLYLGILHEDPTRRCAWEQGRSYRALGYSLFNLSQPATRRFSAVHEFVRRGGRIVAEKVTLDDAQNVNSGLKIIQKRLDLVRSTFGRDAHQDFWVMFALSEIYRDTANSNMIPDAMQLERFLGNGFLGRTTDWVDVHFLAQIQAILYSVRILKQLFDVSVDKETTIERQGILADLPPLHYLMVSRHEIVQNFAVHDRARRSARQLINM